METTTALKLKRRYPSPAEMRKEKEKEKVICMREESSSRLRELLNCKKELTDALCDRMPIEAPELIEKYMAFSEEMDSLIAAEAKLLSEF